MKFKNEYYASKPKIESMDAMYSEPNEETVAAINEARSGKYAGVIDTSSMEAFIKSCE